MASTFFLEENIDILPTATQTAKQAADSVKPIANGDPVTAIPQSAAQVSKRRCTLSPRIASTSS